MSHNFLRFFMKTCAQVGAASQHYFMSSFRCWSLFPPFWIGPISFSWLFSLKIKKFEQSWSRSSKDLYFWMPLFAKTRSKKTRPLHSLLDFRRGFSASKKGSTIRKKTTRKNLSERKRKEKHFEKRLLNELDAFLSENLFEKENWSKKAAKYKILIFRKFLKNFGKNNVI